MKQVILLIALGLLLPSVSAQAQAWRETDGKSKLQPGKDLNYRLELQATASNRQTPLWLNANRYGLSSLDKGNGYLRASLIRPLTTDSARRWGLGYGVDVAVAQGFSSRMVVQQAFAEVRWLHGVLTVGSKQQPMELKNQALSSGSQLLGINARPIPQVRLALPDYWVLPFGGGWLQLKGHIAYGRMTDDDFQMRFTGKKSRYTDDVLFHSKAGYLRIGNEERFAPLSLELGLEMAATFGGRSYQPQSDGTTKVVHGRTGWKSYLKALIPGGADIGETTYQNAEGNQLGSWLARANYDADRWRFSIYADKFFEDHSAMFQLDYDGYGTGGEWMTKKKRRYLLYDFKDWMLGAELNLKYGRYLTAIVLEYLYTKYQSGPIYHDHTQTIGDHIGGLDNYYNHYIYSGWQHWGQVMGNPLYRSPIYNADGVMEVKNNRFEAWHLGVSGQPTEALKYRLLATYQTGWGSYSDPYDKKHHNVSLLLEADYGFKHGWGLRGGCGMDFGAILGRSYGFQLTISKKGVLKI